MWKKYTSINFISYEIISAGWRDSEQLPDWVAPLHAHLPETCPDHDGGKHNYERSYSGWKLHFLSKTPDQVSHVMDAIREPCIKHGIGIKYANDSLLDYLDEYSRTIDPHQEGKGVVAYLPDIRNDKHLSHMKMLVRAVNNSGYDVVGNIHGDTMLSGNVGTRYELAHGLMDQFGNPRNANVEEYNSLYVKNPQTDSPPRQIGTDIIQALRAHRE